MRCAPIAVIVQGAEHVGQAVNLLVGELVGGHVQQQALQARGAREGAQALHHDAAQQRRRRGRVLGQPRVLPRLLDCQPGLRVLLQQPATNVSHSGLMIYEAQERVQDQEG